MARLRADDGITVPSDIQFLYPSTIQLNKVDLNLQNRKASTQTSVIHVDSFFFYNLPHSNAMVQRSENL